MSVVKAVTWEEIEQSIFRTVETWTKPDAIFGIGRGGVPIAIALNYVISDVPLGFVYRRVSRGNPEPFYVFNRKMETRSEREKRNAEELEISDVQVSPKRILVVDDVSTHGGTLDIVGRKLAEKYPDSYISNYCYAVDRTRLSSIRPSVAAVTHSSIDIDNEKIWLRFPWQLTEL